MLRCSLNHLCHRLRCRPTFNIPDSNKMSSIQSHMNFRFRAGQLFSKNIFISFCDQLFWHITHTNALFCTCINQGIGNMVSFKIGDMFRAYECIAEFCHYCKAIHCVFRQLLFVYSCCNNRCIKHFADIRQGTHPPKQGMSCKINFQAILISNIVLCRHGRKAISKGI